MMKCIAVDEMLIESIDMETVYGRIVAAVDCADRVAMRSPASDRLNELITAIWDEASER